MPDTTDTDQLVPDAAPSHTAEADGQDALNVARKMVVPATPHRTPAAVDQPTVLPAA